jgi:hypothetical protein
MDVHRVNYTKNESTYPKCLEKSKKNTHSKNICYLNFCRWSDKKLSIIFYEKTLNGNCNGMESFAARLLLSFQLNLHVSLLFVCNRNLFVSLCQLYMKTVFKLCGERQTLNSFYDWIKRMKKGRNE